MPYTICKGNSAAPARFPEQKYGAFSLANEQQFLNLGVGFPDHSRLSRHDRSAQSKVLSRSEANLCIRFCMCACNSYMMRGADIVVKMSKSGHATVLSQAVISSSVKRRRKYFIDAQRESTYSGLNYRRVRALK